MTYSQVWWPILGNRALHLTRPSAHTQQWTHTTWTHTEQWAAIYAAAPGEQLGVWWLAQEHLSRGIEGGKSAVHSLPSPTIPAGSRLEHRTLRLLSTIRPRLPLEKCHVYFILYAFIFIFKPLFQLCCSLMEIQILGGNANISHNLSNNDAIKLHV